MLDPIDIVNANVNWAAEFEIFTDWCERPVPRSGEEIRVALAHHADLEARYFRARRMS